MIEVRGLTKRYGEVTAVSDLSFDVMPGEVTGFLGPNGAGKTTTIRLILGLDYPNAGTVTIDGKPYASLAYPMREVGALLDARAVHGGPKVLMFDEPVNGLDPEGILWIRNLMKALAAEGRTVFVSSHLMSEMEHTADSLIVIGRGQLLADCTMEEFIARSSGQTVRVATPQPELLAKAVAEAGGTVIPGGGGEALTVSGLIAAQVGDIAFEHGVRLHELTVVRASLEAAFMELTADSVEYRAAEDGPGDGPENGQGQPPEPGQPAEGQPPAPELAAQGQSAQGHYSHEGRI